LIDVIFEVVFPKQGTHRLLRERWKVVFQSLRGTRLAATSRVTAYLKALGGGWKVGEGGAKGVMETVWSVNVVLGGWRVLVVGCMELKWCNR
jgi:hypothetical protein